MLLGLSVERSIQHAHHDYGSLFGKAHRSSPAAAIFAIFESLGSIAFSFSFVSLSALLQGSQVAGHVLDMLYEPFS